MSAVGSGVGTTALQLAKAAGCTVVGTARSPEKLERCRELGLDHAVLAPRELDPVALADEIVAAAGPVDVALELVGGSYLVTDVRAAAPLGRIVLIGVVAGTRAELDMAMVMVKRLRVQGTTLRGRDVEQKAAAVAAFSRDVVPLLAAGDVAPVIARSMPIDDAGEAYDLLASDTVFGKLILATSCCGLSADVHGDARGVLRRVDDERAHAVEPDDPVHRVLAVGELADNLQVVVLAVEKGQVAQVRLRSVLDERVVAQGGGDLHHEERIPRKRDRFVAVLQRLLVRILVVDLVAGRRTVAEGLERERHFVEATRRARSGVDQQPALAGCGRAQLGRDPRNRAHPLVMVSCGAR